MKNWVTFVVKLSCLSILCTGLSLSGTATGWAQAPLRPGQPYAEATKCADPNVIFCEDFNYPQNLVAGPDGTYGNSNWINPGLTTGLFGFIYGMSGRQINLASGYLTKPQGAMPSGSQADYVWVANWDPSKGTQGNGATWGRLREPGGNYANGSAPATDFYIRFQYYVTSNYAWPGDPRNAGCYNYGGTYPYLDNKILFFYPPNGTDNPTNASYDAGPFTSAEIWDSTQNCRFADALSIRVGNAGDNYKIFPGCSFCTSNPQHMEYFPFESQTLRNPGDTPIQGKIFRFNTNQWYTIEVHYKLSSVADAKDGVIEAWVDGTKVYSASDLATCGSASGMATDCSGLGAIYIGAYHNGLDVTVWNGQQLIDNLIVSRAYIGPPAGSSTSTGLPPVAPSGLIVK